MPLIQHLVLLKFKPEITSEKIAELFSQLAELQQLIPGITYFAGGPYSSHEGLNQGYTHGFLMTFESPKTRDTYLCHPKHERVNGRCPYTGQRCVDFVKLALLEWLDSVVAFDFEA